MQLELNKIRRDGGTQPRLQMLSQTVSEYAEDMKNGDTFPPVRVVYDGDQYWLVDGFHRIAAAEQNGYETFECDVLQGTLQDAQWLSFGVNAAHGERRNRWDVQRIIAAALVHPMSKDLSDRAIALHIHCDHKTVGAQRAKLTAAGEVPQSDTRVGSDGVTRTLPGTRSVIVPLIAPPEGGWPTRDEDGSFSTELAEPIFENKGHAQAVIHVLEIEPLSHEPSKHRWIANAALVGVAGCGLSKPLMDRYGREAKTREAAIAAAAQELAEHILRCLQDDKLPESRQSALRHFFAWADTQGADAAKAEATITKEAEAREAEFLDHAEQIIREISGLYDPRYPDDGREGPYDWQKFLAAVGVVLEKRPDIYGRNSREVVEHIDEIQEHFLLFAGAVREFAARQVAA